MEKQDIEYFKKEFNRLHVKLNKLMLENIEDTPKETWVKVSVIQKLTGWKYKELQRARDNGLVKVIRKRKGLSYLLESLNPMFIKEEFRTTNIREQNKSNNNAQY